MEYFQLIAGLAILIAGAELLVKNASRLATSLGISPLVIGLTIVGFGTSTPELFVSATSSFQGNADVAVANVVGSNAFNVLVILGLSATITPLIVLRQLIRVDVPIMIGCSLAVYVLAWNRSLSRTEGILLFTGLVIYTLMLLSRGRVDPLHQDTDVPVAKNSRWINFFWIIAGLALMIGGSRFFVAGAISIASSLGVSREVIGLTIVAIGTSLPEVVTSVVASIRGERDLAVGNVVGSNIFNLLGVLGISAIVAPGGLSISDSAFHFDLPVMIATAIICLPVFLTGALVSRWEGLAFLGLYTSFATYLVLAATHHDSIDQFSTVMLYFVLPILAVGMGFSLLRMAKQRHPLNSGTN